MGYWAYIEELPTGGGGGGGDGCGSGCGCIVGIIVFAAVMKYIGSFWLAVIVAVIVCGWIVDKCR